MASSLFIVNAANPMLIRSRKQTTKSRKTKGRILIRTFWIVLASMDMARAADSLVKVHLGVRLPRPEGSIVVAAGRRYTKVWGTLCLEAAPVKQHADSFPNGSPGLRREVHAAQQVLEARIRAQVIEPRIGLQKYH